MEFEEIYELYFKDVYIFLLNLTRNKTIAEDITQDTFYKALKKIDTYNDKNGVKPWLFTIAKNTYFTEYNRRKLFSKNEVNDQTQFESDILDDIVVKEQSDEILKILHELSEPYKEVFLLRHFGELSFEKISKIFNKGESWARVTYHRAKRQIIEKMRCTDD